MRSLRVLVVGGGETLPVTEAVRDAYQQVAEGSWQTHDVTGLVEYGRHSQ
jgi:hypothetical protein